MLRSLRRYALLALSALGSATLLFSCGDKAKPVSYDYETLLTESSEHRTITMMENGQRSYIFSAPLIEGYSMATNPYQEFRRGILMTTFTSDSLSLIEATIKAQYAIFYERQKLWEAKGNVVINRFNRSEKDTTIVDTTKIYTQQIFWNATTKKIYSNVDTKVLQRDGWHFGVGFEADEDLKNIHFRKYSSEVEFDSAPAPKRERGEDVQEEQKPEVIEFGSPNTDSSSDRTKRKERSDRSKTTKIQSVEDENGAELNIKSQAVRPNGSTPPARSPQNRQVDKPSRGERATEGGKSVGVQNEVRPMKGQNMGASTMSGERKADAVRPTVELNSQMSIKAETQSK